ncbi:MAG: exodeoxyribonuclease III [Cocleimonas sp.]|nr:exodeoxyribonuclease III [Cocleimonas sp.]
MRIITANTNGIRAAARKGFFDWLPQQEADVVCLQETKAQVHQLDDPIFHPDGMFCYYHDAQKKGYSGVALYCKVKPDAVIKGMGHEEFDAEGRYIEAQFGNVSVISLYLPSGSAKEERQQVKYRCMTFFMQKMLTMKASGRDYVICGDWNIAHKKEDLRNWKGNLKKSGFLPEERAWLDTLFDEVGFVDAFREIEQEEHAYTWWSFRGQAYNNNTGWRIDYQILSPSLKGTVLRSSVYKDERFSDHAPLIIDYNKEIPT